MKLDLTDRKLLYYLSLNARLPYTVLASHTGISREAVKARIGRMLESGAVLEFSTILNHPYIGLKFYTMYLRLHKADSAKAKKLRKFISGHDSVLWAIKCIGKWDYALLLIIKNSRDLAETINDFRKNMKGIISEYEFDELLYEYKYTSRLPAFFTEINAKPLKLKKEGSSFYSILDKEISTIAEGQEKKPIDKTDAAILELLSTDCRAPLEELSKKLSIPPENIRYRLKRMVEKKIIAAFWPAINYGAFGFQWYKIRVQTEGIGNETETELRKYFANHQNIIWAARNLGKGDINIDLRVKNNAELNDFLTEFNGRFDGIAADYEILILTEDSSYSNFTKKIFEMAE